MRNSIYPSNSYSSSLAHRSSSSGGSLLLDLAKESGGFILGGKETRRGRSSSNCSSISDSEESSSNSITSGSAADCDKNLSMVWFWLEGKVLTFLPRALDFVLVAFRFPLAEEDRRRVVPVEARRFLVTFFAVEAFRLVVDVPPVDARGVLARATRDGVRMKAFELLETKKSSAFLVQFK